MILYFLLILHRQVSAKQQRYLREVRVDARAPPPGSLSHTSHRVDSALFLHRW
jgi:hypothetical protein